MSGKTERWEYGGFWFSKKTNSKNWNRTWFEPETRQTRRASLGVSDLEDAKQNPIAYMNENCAAAAQSAEHVLLVTVFQRYALQHVKFLSPSSRDTQMIDLDNVAELVGDMSAAEFKLSKQEQIVRQLKEKELNVGSVKRIYGAVRAALNWAYKNEEIDRLPPPLTPPDRLPRDVVASPEELAAIWDEMHHDHW